MALSVASIAGGSSGDPISAAAFAKRRDEGPTGAVSITGEAAMGWSSVKAAANTCVGLP